MLNIFLKAFAWMLACALCAGMLYGGACLFASNYNKVVLAERNKVDAQLRSTLDSIPILEAELRELTRIQQLSFTRPLTSEHVRGEELRTVIEGMTRCEVWLLNKHREAERLLSYKEELDEAIIKL